MDNYQSKLTKKALITMMKNQSIPICDHFEFNAQVIAMYNMQAYPYFPGATVILNQKGELLRTYQTTRQLLNDFSHHNIFDFQQSRMLVRNSQHPHFLPLVLGRWVYLPLAGISHGSTDWVGLHWLQDCIQDNLSRTVNFTTLDDIILQFDYNIGFNLEVAIHQASYYSEYLCRIMSLMVQAAGAHLDDCPAPGLLQQFANCSCTLHDQLPQTDKEVRAFLQQFEDWTLQHICCFPELQLSKTIQAQTIKLWRYELARVHSLW